MTKPSGLTGHTARTTTTIPPLPGNTHEERLLLGELIVGYRIMRTTEVAPGWWGIPREIGETVSALVANRFCSEQNAATMNPNRSKRIEFYAEALYAAPEADPTASARRLIAAGIKRGTGQLVVKAVA